MKINNRRYIGCKTKLLDKIYDTVLELGYNSSNSFADIFAGTGVVGSYFANKGYKVLLNDTLLSNVVAYEAWLGAEKIDDSKIYAFITEMNDIDPNKLEDNYFSNVYGKKYFAINDAKKIGYIRDCLEEKKETFNHREFCYILTSLIYVADKIANTVGHFESYIKKEPREKGVKLSMLEINENIIPAEIKNIDANQLVKEIEYDICYLDPPYNARQYVNFYHTLENLARWNKPTEFEGNSMKFKRNELKSDYCRVNAPTLMEELVKNLKCKLIIVSYNNTYTANSTASNNKITPEQMISILEKKGKVTIKEIEHSFFNAGKTNFKGHKELLYICEVSKK